MRREGHRGLFEATWD